MSTRTSLPSLTPFTQLAPDYRDTLLLGNGASMAIAPGFGYRSLLDHARTRALMTPALDTLFHHFDTADFELVMRLLRDTRSVNDALGISEGVTAPAYAEIRDALIRSVRDTHVEQASILSHLRPISAFMSRFATVLSLNYDLLVYWAMQKAKEYARGVWFKDCWLGGFFDEDWRRLREPYGDAAGSTLVFYPHGHLTLTSHLTRGEAKIHLGATGASNLLDAIFSHWTTGERIPLFVSEGDAAQKRIAISRSGYLNTVYNDVMTDLGRSILVFGWNAGEQDEHILRRLCAPRTERIALSVFRPTGQSDRDLALELARIELRLRQAGFDGHVEFFDASSAGCWNRCDDDGFTA